MPSVVAYEADTSIPLGALSVTANSSAPTSSSPAASATDSAGGSSSSRITPVARACARVAPEGPDNVTAKLSSSASSTASSITGTRMVLAVSPGAKVSVPSTGP